MHLPAVKKAFLLQSAQFPTRHMHEHVEVPDSKPQHHLSHHHPLGVSAPDDSAGCPRRGVRAPVARDALPPETRVPPASHQDPAGIPPARHQHPTPASRRHPTRILPRKHLLRPELMTLMSRRDPGTTERSCNCKHQAPKSLRDALSGSCRPTPPPPQPHRRRRRRPGCSPAGAAQPALALTTPNDKLINFSLGGVPMSCWKFAKCHGARNVRQPPTRHRPLPARPPVPSPAGWTATGGARSCPAGSRGMPAAPAHLHGGGGPHGRRGR